MRGQALAQVLLSLSAETWSCGIALAQSQGQLPSARSSETGILLMARTAAIVVGSVCYEMNTSRAGSLEIAAARSERISATIGCRSSAGDIRSGTEHFTG